MYKSFSDWNEDNRSGDEVDLDNAHSWAEEVGDIVDPIRSTLKTVDKAIETLTKARTFIKGMTSDEAVIINVSEEKGEWSTYNEASPFKFCTQFKSYMGQYKTVIVHTAGCGHMKVYLDNKAPGFTVARNSVHLYDGDGLTLVGLNVVGENKMKGKFLF